MKRTAILCVFFAAALLQAAIGCASYSTINLKGGVQLHAPRILHDSTNNREYFTICGVPPFCDWPLHVTLPHDRGGVLRFNLWNDFHPTHNIIANKLNTPWRIIENITAQSAFSGSYREYPGSWGAAGGKLEKIEIPAGVKTFTFYGTGSQTGLEISDIVFTDAAIDQALNPPPKPSSAILPGDRWAVIIGISEYRDSRIPPLRYATADASAFHEWLVSPTGGRYAPQRVMLLLDGDATGENMKSALFEWLKQALSEDMVTVYFAGHGSPESPDNQNNLFLLPYDAKYDNIPSTGFPMWDVETALKRYIKAKRVVVIADACHAAGVGQSFDIARRANRGLRVNPISSSLSELSMAADGVAIISASADNQYSQEGREWGGGHGVFTHFLLQGLKGDADFNKDGKVNLGELNLYLSEQVRRATRNAQSPIVSGKFDPALTIAR